MIRPSKIRLGYTECLRSQFVVSREANLVSPLDKRPNYQFTPARNCTPKQDDFMTGRSATGIVHVLIQTMINFFSKEKNTVETSTYGSKFVAGRTATEQIIDL